MNLKASALALAIAGVTFVSPALAAKPPSSITPATTCTATMATAVTGVGLTVLDCSGFYFGNLNNNADFPDVKTLLEGTDGAGPLGEFPNIAIGTSIIDQVDTSAGPVSFRDGLNQTITLLGKTVVGVHWGGNDTAFYLLDITSPTTSIGVALYNPKLGTEQGGLSNVALYSTTPVPEPETYALMLFGLTVVGVAARRRKFAAA